jgi:hypothetical protein
LRGADLPPIRLQHEKRPGEPGRFDDLERMREA